MFQFIVGIICICLAFVNYTSMMAGSVFSLWAFVIYITCAVLNFTLALKQY